MVLILHKIGDIQWELRYNMKYHIELNKGDTHVPSKYTDMLLVAIARHGYDVYIGIDGCVCWNMYDGVTEVESD